MNPDAHTDAYRSWELALRAWRERDIRTGIIPPNPNSEEELRWADEGSVAHTRDLDTVRNG